MDARDFKNLGVDETLKRIGTGIGGLSEKEAEKRLKKYGYNEVVEKKESAALKFLSKFYGPVPLILWAVIAISYLLGRTEDFYILLALLLFNATMSFLEESKADRTLESLRKRLSVSARALRSGNWEKLPARLLTIGDIVRVRQGDIIPADLKIVRCDADVETDESVITGESLPISKGTAGVLYEGAILKRGEATCAVIGTGYNTFYGKTASLVEVAKPKSHIQQAILRLAKYLVAIDLAVVAAMFLYGSLALHINIIDVLPFFLVVFLASVPVALPATFTVAMALGTEKLAKENILVRRLDSIEGAATMTVLCADKTGTLTENIITVDELMPFGVGEDRLIRYAAEASRAEDNDPIDNAVLNYAKANRVKANAQLRFTPFDLSTKMTEAVVEGKDGRYRVVKGAIIAVKRLCHIGTLEGKAMDKAVDAFSKRGFRCIAVAFLMEGGKHFRCAGIIALHDSPRKDAGALISELEELGVKTKMLTGDNIAVAEEISKELRIGNRIIDAEKLGGSKKELYASINGADGFANIYPEDKYTIVKALQNSRMIVGMTGDGVNDAPALKQAEVGIAVSSATDVAKEAAALVLTRNGIEVIVHAVKESRRIFERMSTYTMLKISRAIQIIAFIGIVYMFMHGMIAITPSLLVLLIFTNDIVNITISADNAVYAKRPDSWNIRSFFYPAGAVGAVLVLQALILIPLAFSAFGMSVAEFQTLVFLLLVVSDKFTILNFREKGWFWKSRPSSKVVLSSAVGITAGTLMAYFGILVPKIGIVAIVSAFVLSIVFLPINDVVKKGAIKALGR